MFVLKVENSKGYVLELTDNEENYQITNIEGLDPPKADINTSSYANNDGFSFNGSKIKDREIVITMKINGDVEENRLKLYKYFRIKEWCKIYYKSELRDVFIEGYVQTMDAPKFTQNTTAQISILCPDPYFKDVEIMVQSISKIIKKFVFPFSIDMKEPTIVSEVELEKISNIVNDSETETGLMINILFMGTVNKLEIRNIDTGKNIIIDYEFKKNDKLIINCNRGNKTVILTRDAVKYNLIPFIRKGYTFFQLEMGDNQFSFLADDGADDMLVDINLSNYKIYSGV